MKLDFIVAGFSKCGTTSLCNMLKEHPNLFMPPRKEPRIFSAKDYPLLWSWYQNLFFAAPADALLGEGSVTYSEYEFAYDSIKRIHRHFPKIKIILIARDPVDRIESSYREMHHSGIEWGVDCAYTIEEALVQIPNMLEDTKYGEILDIYHQFIPKENILVLFQEDLKSQTEAVLEECFSFLGVKSVSFQLLKKKQLNQGTDKFYDTPKFRELRDEVLHPKTAHAASLIPVAVLNQFIPQLNLRKAFGREQLEWSAAAKEHALRVLGNGSRDFLTKHDKDISFWPRYARFLNEQC